MIHFNIVFKKWIVEVFIVLDTPDAELISLALKDLNCPKSTYKKAMKTLNYVDTGFTYSNEGRSLMVINRSSSMREFINTYNHEKNHVEMHMCEYLGIDPYSELAAYLSGELARNLFAALVAGIMEYLF